MTLCRGRRRRRRRRRCVARSGARRTPATAADDAVGAGTRVGIGTVRSIRGVRAQP
ncbi:unnamed protein product [Ectocarpus sp. 12 AP-2014]